MSVNPESDRWVRVPEPRLRVRPAGGMAAKAKAATNAALNDSASAGHLTLWWPAIYEPETASFGGPAGTGIAHDLFFADSRHMLPFLRQPPPGVGRRELSMLLCGVLLSAAGLDRFERGDLWGAAAFRHAGERLGEAAFAGNLTRGLRQVAVHLVIFHWNRLGLDDTAQAILSRAARDALFPRS